MTIISIHAPTRGATNVPKKSPIHNPFQSTLPQGERLWYVKYNFNITIISIHAPTRGATDITMIFSFMLEFQSTLPQGERPLYDLKTSHPSDFNPRSHKGSDLGDMSRDSDCRISIHAPTRGATWDWSSKKRRGYISIHAPTRGATLAPLRQNTSSQFQSTLPQGERPK